MHGNITSDLSFCLAEEGFSLDELVLKLSELYERKALNEIVRLILQLVQEVLLHRYFSGQRLPFKCCDHQDFSLNGSYNRRLRTSVGEVNLSWNRLKCRDCGKSFAVLKRFLNLENYQTRSNEFERLVVETVAETSYRRSVKMLEKHGKAELSHRTAHHWVMRTDCDEIKISDDVVGLMPLQVLADGTKYKGNAVGGEARKGDLKVVIGVNTAGDVFPLGSWSGSSWDDINREWKEHQVKLPDGSVLIADGEPGIAGAFADYVEYHQRCHWHIERDLYHAMYQDGGTVKEVKPLQQGLAGVLAIELPEGDFQQVSEAEKDAIEEQMELAEEAVGRLINHLSINGYGKAAEYFSNAKRSMFGYVRRWLKLGLICPRASSLVERVMRELGRRLKKIAYGWSDKGAVKIAKIILKKFTSEKEWEEYWKNKMNIIGNVFFDIGNFKVSSQNLAH